MYKKLIVRADDVGYTLAFDLGAFKAIDEGIVTAADVMLDSPHTVEALKWLKERPWISIGWHRHLWESPVLPPEEVPSMVDDEGRFKWRHNMNQYRKEATYDDCYREFCAELDRCIEIYGTVPDTATIKDTGSELERAYRDVCNKYNVDVKFWDDKKMYITTDMQNRNDGKFKYDRYDLSHFNEYDPAAHFMTMTWDYPEQIVKAGGHPGFLDDHILAESTCNIHRPRELQCMMDERLIQWIIDNKIELINSRDAKFGTHEYQDHLKEINSKLWVGNFD